MQSRVEGFHKKTVEERIRIVRAFAHLTEPETAELGRGLSLAVADNMIECVVGVYALPFAIVPNFRMNDSDFFVPLVVEEPSIVSGLSFAGKISRERTGISCEYTGSWMTGQVLLRNIPSSDVPRVLEVIFQKREEIKQRANAVEAQSTILRTGGGVHDVHSYVVNQERGLVGVDFTIDVKEAHGANFITRMMEGIAPYLTSITGAERGLAILSNDCPSRLVRAEMRVPFAQLARKKEDLVMPGEEVAHAIEDAASFAQYNSKRAVTHNKGIMNGVDALLTATGNDWRAQEAGAHAYAGRRGTYKPLSDWRVENEYLVGTLEMPVQVGSVGGITGSHPLVKIALKIIGKAVGEERASTTTLSKLCGAVGLAQNLAGLYTLSTTGIIKGHVWKHGRNYCLAAGIPHDSVDAAVRRMIDEKDVSDRRAREIAPEYR